MLAAGDVLVAVLLLGVMLTGLLVLYRSGRTRKSPPAPVLPAGICGCGHHQAYHTGGTGRCAQKIRVPFGSVLTQDGPCPCQKYIPKTGQPAAELKPGGFDPLYTEFLEWLKDHPDKIPPGA
jgi:hypothetical protein